MQCRRVKYVLTAEIAVVGHGRSREGLAAPPVFKARPEPPRPRSRAEPAPLARLVLRRRGAGGAGARCPLHFGFGEGHGPQALHGGRVEASHRAGRRVVRGRARLGRRLRVLMHRQAREGLQAEAEVPETAYSDSDSGASEPWEGDQGRIPKVLFIIHHMCTTKRRHMPRLCGGANPIRHMHDVHLSRTRPQPVPHACFRVTCSSSLNSPNPRAVVLGTSGPYIHDYILVRTWSIPTLRSSSHKDMNPGLANALNTHTGAQSVQCTRSVRRGGNGDTWEACRGYASIYLCVHTPQRLRANPR